MINEKKLKELQTKLETALALVNAELEAGKKPPTKTWQLSNLHDDGKVSKFALELPWDLQISQGVIEKVSIDLTKVGILSVEITTDKRIFTCVLDPTLTVWR